jgi:ribosomal protein L17
MPAPKKGARFGKSASHQKLMLANLASHLIVSEQGAITTTEAKAKMLRPYVEKLVTKSKHGGVHKQRQVVTTRKRRLACSAKSVRATPTATAATCASSSSARAPATTRRWPASSSSNCFCGLARPLRSPEAAKTGLDLPADEVQ